MGLLDKAITIAITLPSMKRTLRRETGRKQHVRAALSQESRRITPTTFTSVFEVLLNSDTDFLPFSQLKQDGRICFLCRRMLGC